MMSSLASLVVRRRRAVITIWAVLLIGAGIIGSSAFSVLSSSFGAGPSTQSGRVTGRLDDLAETEGEIAIIADGIDVDDPAVAASVTAGLGAQGTAPLGAQPSAASRRECIDRVAAEDCESDETP